MEEFGSVGEFWERVGLFNYYEDFEDLDIEPSDLLAVFDKCRERELVEFCHGNPEFHIVSMTEPGLFVNGYTPKGRIYFLADGDRNPNLVYIPKPSDFIFIDR